MPIKLRSKLKTYTDDTTTTTNNIDDDQRGEHARESQQFPRDGFTLNCFRAPYRRDQTHAETDATATTAANATNVINRLWAACTLANI